MQDRFTFYGILLIIVYLGITAWQQQEEIVYLKGVILDQNEAITKQKELIDVQIQYIDILAPEYYNPINKDRGDFFNKPI